MFFFMFCSVTCVLKLFSYWGSTLLNIHCGKHTFKCFTTPRTEQTTLSNKRAGQTKAGHWLSMRFCPNYHVLKCSRGWGLLELLCMLLIWKYVEKMRVFFSNYAWRHVPKGHGAWQVCQKLSRILGWVFVTLTWSQPASALLRSRETQC